jgi:hypothetical protein
MLLGAVSVVVVVAAGEGGEEPAQSTQAIAQALRAALAPDAAVVVRNAAAGTSVSLSEEALEAAATAERGTTAGERATLVGVVVWSERHQRAALRFSRRPDGRWTERELRFAVADAPSERGRTVGFALASMMPDEAFAAPAAPPPTSPPASEPSAAAPAAPAPSVVGPAGGAPAAPAFEAPRGPPAVVRPNPLALDVSALAATAPGAYGGGVGGAFAVRLPVYQAVGVRASIGARQGQLGPAQATTQIVIGGLGMTWQPWLDASRRWGGGGRVTALLINQDVSHFSEDDAVATHLAHLVVGMDAAFEGTFRFAERAAVIGALGAELALGTTEVFVRGNRVGSLAPARVTGELGLRVSF